jgi:LysM repeat protein
MMISRQKLIPGLILILILLMSLFLAGCVRPIPEDDTTAVPTEPDTSDPNVGGGTGFDPTAVPETDGQLAPTEVAPYPETDNAAESEAYPSQEITEEEVVVETESESETTEAAATPESTPEATEPTPTAEPETTTDTSANSADCPSEHVVQSGENLFRIGLQYGLSWVALAQYNGITNPNNITVGQTIKIPCDGTTTPPVNPPIEPPVEPTLPPENVTTYTVQPGDNLFRISLKFGVSWVEIAEANGIVNPNEIYAGQVLKIPTSAPGPRPEFTHVVKQDETIYSISLQYGVPAVAIAEANNLQEPYVIYAGQTLIIPGNG